MAEEQHHQTKSNSVAQREMLQAQRAMPWHKEQCRGNKEQCCRHEEQCCGIKPFSNKSNAKGHWQWQTSSHCTGWLSPQQQKTNVKQDIFGFPFITVVFLLHRVSGVLAPGNLFWGVMHHFHFSWSQLIVLWKFFVRLKVQIGNAKWNFHPEIFTYIWNVRIFVGGFIRETTVLLSSEWTRLFSKLDVYVQLWITSYWLIQNKTISCDREATHTMSTLPMKSENSLCRRRDVPVGCTFSWRGTPFLLVVHFVVACPPTTIPL